MPKKPAPLQRITFTIPRDIMKFIVKIKRVNQRRSLQDSFEDMGRMAMKEFNK